MPGTPRYPEPAPPGSPDPVSLQAGPAPVHGIGLALQTQPGSLRSPTKTAPQAHPAPEPGPSLPPQPRPSGRLLINPGQIRADRQRFRPCTRRLSGCVRGELGSVTRQIGTRLTNCRAGLGQAARTALETSRATCGITPRRTGLEQTTAANMLRGRNFQIRHRNCAESRH